MGHKNAKDMRLEAIEKRGRKKGGKLRKQETFRNDQLQGWLFKLLDKPEFAHLKPKREGKSDDNNRNRRHGKDRSKPVRRGRGDAKG